MIFSKSKKMLTLALLFITLLMVIIFYALAFGWLGKHDGPGVITDKAIPQAIIKAVSYTHLTLPTNREV